MSAGFDHRPRLIDGPLQLEWMEHGTCRGATHLFFPDTTAQAAAAKKICAGCPVREECLEYALDANEEHGIWGGLSRQERAKLPRGLKIASTARCGTTGGYRAHFRRGEPYCDECRAANAAYKRARQATETVEQREARLAAKARARRGSAA